MEKVVITKLIRVVGLIALISYMTTILFVWIYANLKGHTYFSAGEPNLPIKYYEWILGGVGLATAVDYLRKEVETK